MLKLKVLSKFSDQLYQSFGEMRDDDYLKTSFNFRKRCYSTGKIIDNIFSWNKESSGFLQDKTINNYVGGISRNYNPIASNIKDDVYQKVILSAYSQLPPADYDVGVHQIRIIANTDNQGIPTPEGIHQDGFDYVTVTCVNVNNMSGGISVLLDAQDYTKVEFEGILYPGMQIVFSDKTFAHYTSNITPIVPGEAFRDVIVTTFLTINNK